MSPTQTMPSPTARPELAAGAWLHNPATGELARMNVGPAETGGRRIEVDLWLQPGAAVARAHVHDHLDERFEVLTGEVGFQVARGERVVRPGAGVVEVLAGTRHDWWNAGEGIAHVRVEVEAAAHVEGRPAARFVSMIEALWSLGALGEVNAAGMPDPLWLAAIARAAGLRSYGFDEDFIALCEGLLEAAAAFPEFRLPELFAGFSRQEYEAPVPYPVACRPQAWAAGAVPYVLVTALGIRPDALNRVLRIRRPLLPRMLDSVWLRGLRVAGATVDLRFERVRAGDPAAAVTEAQVDGDVDVVVDLTGQPPSLPMAAAARQAPQEAQTPAEAPHAAATYRS